MEKNALQQLERTGHDAWCSFLQSCTLSAMPTPPEAYASPIESMMAVALYVKLKTIYLADAFWFCPRLGLTVEAAKAACVARKPDNEYGGIFPQVSIGDYRVDFLALHISDQQGSAGYSGIVVECDGHDFHERTKEQVRRDKMRDRDLQLSGYTVLRYAGSEIWADAFRCADEVVWAALNAALAADPTLGRIAA